MAANFINNFEKRRLSGEEKTANISNGTSQNSVNVWSWWMKKLAWICCSNPLAYMAWGQCRWQKPNSPTPAFTHNEANTDNAYFNSWQKPYTGFHAQWGQYQVFNKKKTPGGIRHSLLRRMSLQVNGNRVTAFASTSTQLWKSCVHNLPVYSGWGTLIAFVTMVWREEGLSIFCLVFIITCLLIRGTMIKSICDEVMPGRVIVVVSTWLGFSFASTLPKLSMNTVKHSSGEILTGKLWWKDHGVMRQLPFYSNITGIDNLTTPLEAACQEGSFKESLIVRFILYLS